MDQSHCKTVDTNKNIGVEIQICFINLKQQQEKNNPKPDLHYNNFHKN